MSTDSLDTIHDLVRRKVITSERRDEIEERTDRCLAKFKRLMRDEVLVRLRPRRRMVGSIFLPLDGKERNLVADVLAVGPGRREQRRLGDVLVWKFRPTEVKPGDVVRLHCLQIKFLEDFGDDGAILLVTEEVIAGVFEEEAA
jgi:co-chaperonin GroES (HSP10)